MSTKGPLAPLPTAFAQSTGRDMQKARGLKLLWSQSPPYQSTFRNVDVP
jgi:hypothetical protein